MTSWMLSAKGETVKGEIVGGGGGAQNRLNNSPSCLILIIKLAARSKEYLASTHTDSLKSN